MDNDLLVKYKQLFCFFHMFQYFVIHEISFEILALNAMNICANNDLMDKFMRMLNIFIVQHGKIYIYK